MSRTPIKLPADPRSRVIRGGAWYYNDAAWVRAAARLRLAPAGRDDYLGFRCAQRGARMTVKVQP